jgi:hypothetical protein
MATYVGFYNIFDGLVVPACGDRSMIQLDGRLSTFNMHTIARGEAKKRRYQGFLLIAGNSLLSAEPLQSFISLCAPFTQISPLCPVQDAKVCF